MLEEGHEYAVMLYTWRSCSRAIPQVKKRKRKKKESELTSHDEPPEPHLVCKNKNKARVAGLIGHSQHY